MAEEVLFTAEALRKREEHLEYLKTFKMKEVAERIEKARSFGDLSENSEYDEAKEAQTMLMAEIASEEDLLKRARVISDDEHVEGRVGINSIVEVEEYEDDEVVDTYTLTICGEGEEDPNNNVISYQAPIGKGLMGHETGEKVDIEVPMGIITLRILSVTRS